MAIVVSECDDFFSIGVQSERKMQEIVDCDAAMHEATGGKMKN